MPKGALGAFEDKCTFFEKIIFNFKREKGMMKVRNLKF